MVATVPDRSDGVGDEAGTQSKARCELGVADGASPETTTRGTKFGGPRGGVDCTVDTTAPGEACIRRVHDHVDVLKGDVALDDLNHHRADFAGGKPRRVGETSTIAAVIAISSLLLVITVTLVVTRIATVLLVASGMSHEVARFQARSALTGAGFTTGESEAVVRHPVRRRIVMTLMLIGNAGLVASAGTLILGFSGHSAANDWRQVIELVLGLLTLVFISRSSWVDRRLTRLVGHFVHRYSDLSQRDLGGLLQLTGGYAVKELAVTESDWIAHRTLAELALREEGIIVLGLTREDGHYLGAPVARTEVRPGDLLIVYGDEEALAELDRRERGAVGDAHHHAGVARQRRREEEQAAVDGAAQAS